MSLQQRGVDLGVDRFAPDGGAPSRLAVVLRPELVLLAMASLGAAVLHAAFAPGHFDADWAHGLFFASVAWGQLLLAIGLVAIQRRWVYALGLLNVVVIITWIVSRTSGLPFGPSSGVTEEVGTPDLVATGLEAVVVLGCAGLLFRLRRGRPVQVETGTRWLLGAAVFGAALVAASSTAALTPRFAGGHHEGSAETAEGVANNGHPHDSTGATATDTGAVPTLTGNTPCEKSGPPASQGSVMEAEGHNTRGPIEQIAIDRPTTELLQQQQTIARGVAEKYPTVADAEAAGYQASSVFVPCIGAHYTNIGLVGGFDPAAPSELLFDGTKPESKIVGLSYLVYHPGGAPEGFAGPNDHWHQHNANEGLCFSRANGIVIGAEDVSPEDCAQRGGVKRELPDIWMLHDWIVPGWECSWGVFAPECPELGGTTGADAWTR